jgi:DNA-binding response OmpR family regulator
MAKPIILMVESDFPTIELYRETLGQEYDVLPRNTEAGALEVLSTGDVRAIILEPTLGGGRGWEIFAAIRKATRKPPIPLIVCTTSGQRKRGLEMGAAAFLVKPVLPSVLLETLRQFQYAEPIG